MKKAFASFYKKYLMGFTLMEIVIVVLVLGVLATITIHPFNGIMERARDSEARTNLMLIQAAERVYYAENGVACIPPACGNLGAINSELNLNLNANQWAYSIGALPAPPANHYQASAQRLTPPYSNGGFNRSFTLLSNETTPACTGTCP